MGEIIGYMRDRINVTRSSMPTLDEYVEEIRDLWDSHWLTNAGPKHEELRQKLAEYLGVDGIEIFTNGHMAIELSLHALGLYESSVYGIVLRIYIAEYRRKTASYYGMGRRHKGKR